MLFLFFSLLVFAETLMARDYTIGVSYWSDTIKGQIAMKKGIEEQVKHINSTSKDKINLVTHIAGDGRNGIKNQISDLNKLMSIKPDLIIIQPTSTMALGQSLLKINKLNIPVVTYDQFISQGETVSFITSNNYQAGFLAGEYIASLYENKTLVKLVIVEFPSISSTNSRVHGFINSLKKSNQNYKIIDTFNAIEPIAGYKVGKEILKRYPITGSIDVVFTVNDGAGLKIVETLSAGGRDEIKVATVDGDPLSVENIKNQNLTVINSAQFCSEIGRQSLQTAYDYLKGREVPKRILIPTYPVTKETLKTYPGWLGKIPPAFYKQWVKSNIKDINNLWDNSYKKSNF